MNHLLIIAFDVLLNTGLLKISGKDFLFDKNGTALVRNMTKFT